MTKVLMSGNDAVVEGAIRAGVDCYFGYPITPQNEIIAGMAARLPPLGRVFLQSESELAAISMVEGAAAAGKRAMTTSSSPGISLMQEGISYMTGAQVPCIPLGTSGFQRLNMSEPQTRCSSPQPPSLCRP